MLHVWVRGFGKLGCWFVRAKRRLHHHARAVPATEVNDALQGLAQLLLDLDVLAAETPPSRDQNDTDGTPYPEA